MATAVAVHVQPPQLPGTDITLTKEQADAANAEVRHRIDAMEVEHQLRGLVQENINRLPQNTGLSAAAKLGGEAFAGALPILSPFTLPVRFGAYRYTSCQQFRAQGIDPQAASLMSTGVAILQLAGDQLRVSALRYGGPVKKFLGKAGTSPVTRISAHWLDAAATGTLLSSATQHLAPGLVQDVASFFDDTVPGTDWKKTTRELVEAAPVTLATMIVMAPVMGGILRAARIKNFDVFARVPEALRRMGFRRTAAERIINAPPGEAGRVFEQTLKENPPDPSSPEPAPARAVPDKSGEAAPPDKTAPVRQTGHTPPDKTTEAPSPDKTAEPAPSPDNAAERTVPHKASEPATPDKSGQPAPPDKTAPVRQTEHASPDKTTDTAAPDKAAEPAPSPDGTAARTIPDNAPEPAAPDKTTEAVSPDKSGEPLTPDKTTEPAAADDFTREQQRNEEAGLRSMAPDESGQWHLQTKSGQRLTAGSLEAALRMRETMRATRQRAATLDANTDTGKPGGQSPPGDVSSSFHSEATGGNPREHSASQGGTPESGSPENAYTRGRLERAAADFSLYRNRQRSTIHADHLLREMGSFFLKEGITDYAAWTREMAQQTGPHAASRFQHIYKEIRAAREPGIPVEKMTPEAEVQAHVRAQPPVPAPPPAISFADGLARANFDPANWRTWLRFGEMFELLRRPDAVPAHDAVLVPKEAHLGRFETHAVMGWVDDALSFIPPGLIPRFKGVDKRMLIRMERVSPKGDHILGNFDGAGVRPVITLYLEAKTMDDGVNVKRALFHEIGHWLEWLAGPEATGLSGEAKQILKTWVDSKNSHFYQRTGKEPAHSTEGYLLGGFYTEYAGRQYPEKTNGMDGPEVIPKHFELFADPEALEEALRSTEPGASPLKTIETLLKLTTLFQQK